MELISKATLLILFSFSLLLQTPAFADTKTNYIVYLGGHPPSTNEDAVIDAHNELLGSILKDKEKAKASIFYYYTYSINGFAANLDEETAKQLSKHPTVVSVFPEKFSQLHTTHSWEFLGLNLTAGGSSSSLWEMANYGENVIIANLDTGVWPESASFSDEGLGPIPSKWKGICQNDKDKDFKCNRKLIGARYYNNGGLSNETYYNSPRDSIGHGTHTLSTAGGSFVPDASFFGCGAGVAKGGAPRARVASYKACWERGCSSADLLAAFDDAIRDGVDVISISLGGSILAPILEDPLSIGSFHALTKGILVVSSAGNSVPAPSTVTNLAPWVITVAASTMDRDFTAALSFNNITVQGKSLSDKALPGKNEYPMILAGKARLNSSSQDGYNCLPNTLDPKKVQGKIVACLGGGEVYKAQMGKAVLDAGGVGMVILYDLSATTRIPEVLAFPHVLPATEINVNDSITLLSYLYNTESPTGYISLPQTAMNLKPAPVMASFSALGPNPLTSNLLKPDITAPGESILAAFTNASSPTFFDFDTRRVAFNVLSGTSMSCPHISGVGALLKSANPTWSPAMIKSAIMTTAEVYDNTGGLIQNITRKAATPFSYGAGHVSPTRAMDPGLVYDITVSDYLDFLCNFYSSDDLKNLTGIPHTCPSPAMKNEDLNYPAIMTFLDIFHDTMNVTRTLTNVGTPPGQYKVSVQQPSGVNVTINPTTLNFSKIGEQHQYQITLKLVSTSSYYEFGKIAWSDGKHNVTIPVIVGHHDH